MSSESPPDVASTLPRSLQQAIAPLQSIGITAWGVADGTPLRHVLPGCASVLVGADLGTMLWRGMMEALADGRLPAGPDPLDRWIRAHLPTETAALRAIDSSLSSPVHLDFRRLAIEAGLGWDSRLKMVLHPEAGPWMGLRVALLTTEALPVTGPLPSPAPCDGCPAPCQTACPAGALKPDLDITTCMDFQQRAEGCPSGCHARMACVVGPAFAQGEAQLRFHRKG